jgi:2-oxoglutarate ferredoxin oxidoreductase subunit beta
VKYSKKAIEYLKFPLGILYINPNKTPYEDILSVYWEEKTHLYEREVDMDKLKALIESKRKI